MREEGIRYCLKCDKEFLSKDRIKIRRCDSCKKKAYGIPEGYSNMDDIGISNGLNKILTSRFNKSKKDTMDNIMIEIECHDVKESDYLSNLEKH